MPYEMNEENKPQEENTQANPKFSPIQIAEEDPIKRMEKESAIVNRCTGKFTKWDQWRKPFENIWNEIYKLYFNVAERSKVPSRSRITVPIAFQIIEAAVPKIITTLFTSQEAFSEVLASNPDDQSFGDVIQLLITYQLGQADFFLKFIDFTKQLLLYGTSYFKVYWKTKRKWVWEKVPSRRQYSILGFQLGDVLEWTENKEYKIIETRPEIDVLDILDVFPDPEARTEKDGQGVFIRSWMDIDDLKDMGKGEFPKYANTNSPDLQPDKTSFLSSRNVRYTSRGVNTPPISDPNQVEILEFWGNYDLDGDGIKEEAYIVIANRKILLKAIPNPFDHQKRPLIRAICFPVPMEWFGIGLIEPVIANIHELWTLRRQRLDNINLVINRMWKVLDTADIDLDTLISSPNGIIVTGSMDGLEQIETNDVTSNAFNEAAAVTSEIEKATTPESVQGTPSSGRLGRTAKGAQLIITQALEKFGTIIKLVEEMAVKRTLRMFHQLNLQFLDNDEVFRVTGFYGHLFDEEITPEMIRAEVNFRMMGISDMVNKEGKINQIVSFMGVFGKVLSGETISTLAKKVWQLMGFSPKDVDIQGMQPQEPIQGGVVDQNISNAITGQAGNGDGAPPAVPGAPSM